jgi:hypothetical protein
MLREIHQMFLSTIGAGLEDSYLQFQKMTTHYLREYLPTAYPLKMEQ